MKIVAKIFRIVNDHFSVLTRVQRSMKNGGGRIVSTFGFWKGSVAFAVAVVVLGMSGNASAADLVVGAFGGIWERSFRECVVDPFQKETGKSVDIVLGSAPQWLNQIAANPTKPPLDVMMVASDYAYDAINRGLVDKFTIERVPNLAKIAKRFTEVGDGYGVTHNYGSMGLIYNKATVPNPPKTWKEFVEGTVSGKWKSSAPSINYTGGGSAFIVYQLSTIYGGDIDNIEPGLAQAKRMLDSRNLTLWTDPNQVLNDLKSGEIDIAAYWDGRAWAFIDDGNAGFGYLTPAPGAIAGITWVQKAKGSADLGFDFVNFALDAKRQSCFGSKVRYGTGNVDAVYDPAVAQEITKIDEIIIPPFKDLPPRQAKWLEQWNKELGR
jgi:putative spermidine/putrescine transport system substrate-binding protein